jgi:hypothetical protein
LIPGPSVWNVWWREWKWDRLFSWVLRLPLLSFHQCSTHHFIHLPSTL